MKIIKIQIVKADQSNTKIQHSNGTIGYWVEYQHSLIEGCCYFIPYNDQTIELYKDYSVETGQEKVIKITNSNDFNNSIHYNAELNTYEVIGNVSFISDDGEILIVSVQDVDFSISNEDYDIRNFRMNDRLMLEIKGLTLWDEGIY